MQVYRKMLENDSLDIQNFQAPLHYSPDYERSLLL